MNEVIFEVVKVVVMAAALLVVRYLVPCLRERISADKLAQAEKWARYAVLKAQQVFWAKDGMDRKTYVVEFLQELLTAGNIALTEEQLDVLIEAAVKQMKIEENAGLVVETGEDAQETMGGMI